MGKNVKHFFLNMRKKIFAGLVDAQDGGMTVPESYKHIAGRYKINYEMIRMIENEGLDQCWPPLEDE